MIPLPQRCSRTPGTQNIFALANICFKCKPHHTFHKGLESRWESSKAQLQEQAELLQINVHEEYFISFIPHTPRCRTSKGNLGMYLSVW